MVHPRRTTPWAAVSTALFLLGGFVNLMPDIKGTNHFWGNLGILLDGDYICSTEEVVFAVAFHAALVAIPAVVFGWVLQALALVILGVGGGSLPPLAPEAGARAPLPPLAPAAGERGRD